MFLPQFLVGTHHNCWILWILLHQMELQWLRDSATPRLRLYGAYDFLQPLQCAILVHDHEGANPGRVAPCKARDEDFVADVGMGWIRMELIFVRCVCTCLHCSYLFRSLFLTVSTWKVFTKKLPKNCKKVGFCGCVTEMVLRATQPPSSPQNTDCVGTQIGTISETKKK